MSISNVACLYRRPVMIQGMPEFRSFSITPLTNQISGRIR
jgi:hypothetical protein